MESISNTRDSMLVELEGATILASSNAGNIIPGDTYIAKRNTGWKLLTCRFVANNAVFPIEIGYAFDEWECFKVIDIL